MMRFLILVMTGLVGASAASGSVTTTTEQEAKLHGEKTLEAGTIKEGERVDVLGESGAWYTVRYKTASGEMREGRAAIRAFARTGDTATAMRDTPVFGLTRPVLATIPAESKVEIVRSVDDGYVVRFTPSGGKPVEGVVHADVIPDKDEITVLRAELAQALGEKARERSLGSWTASPRPEQAKPRLPVTVTIAEEAQVYAADATPIAQLKAGQRVEILGERGVWYVVRFRTQSNESAEGLAHTGAFARTGDSAEAIDATDVYPLTRPVVATLPAGSHVDVLGFAKGGYRIGFMSSDGESVEGIVPAAAIPRDEVTRAMDQQGAVGDGAFMPMLNALAISAVVWEEETFEAFYQSLKHSYAVVAGEIVRLPPFDLDYKNSRGAAPLPEQDRGKITKYEWRTELPAWKVGEFGRVGPLKVLRVLSPERMLCEYRAAGADGTGEGIVCLTGWSTKNVSEGEFWHGDIAGPEGGKNQGAVIAIVDTFTYTKPDGEFNTVLQPIPMAQVRRGISRTEFERFVWREGLLDSQDEK